ncbi:MAG: hypothetical protein WBA54_13985 [Acidaminobacteraceae bacterium]
MITLRRLKKIISQPSMLYFYALSKTNKVKLFKLVSDKLEDQNISGLKFVLSFDCDTDLDIEVVEDVNNRLIESGVHAVYAVPGELLIKGKSVYKILMNSGCEFINHGYRIHTIKDESGKYASVFDYHLVSEDEVVEDIVLGDKVLKDEFNYKPRGFRTPHFGSYQTRAQLKLLYKTLEEKEYTFSTSTIPHFGFKNGMVYKEGNLIEFPISGMISEPLRIFDSFLFYNQINAKFDEDKYYEEGLKILEFYKANPNLSGVINIYADPSQIYESHKFFKLMKEFAQIGENKNYSEILDEKSAF